MVYIWKDLSGTSIFQQLICCRNLKLGNCGRYVEKPSNLQDVATKYDSYLEETLNEKKSKTAQFWMTCAKIAGLIQRMKRAIKINNTELYSF